MSSAAIQAIINRETPAHLIPVLAHDRQTGLYYTEDGYLGFCFVSNPMLYGGDDIADKINVLLCAGFPAHSFLSFLQYSSPDISQFCMGVRNMRAGFLADKVVNDPTGVLQESLDAKIEMFEECVARPIESRNKTRVRDIVIMVSGKIPCENFGQPSDADYVRARELCTSLKQSLESVGLPSVQVPPEYYIHFMGTILNWGENAEWKSPETAYEYDEETMIRDQIFDLESRIDLDRKGLFVGKKRVSALSPKRLPDYMSLASAHALLGDPRTGSKGIRQNFACCLNVYFPEPHKEKASLDNQRNFVQYQAFGPMLSFVPRIGLKKQSFDDLYEAMGRGDTVVKICPFFLLFTDSDTEANEAVANMISYYREIGYQLQEDRFITLPLLLQALPLCQDKELVKMLFRYHTVATSHAAQLVPIVGDWKGTGSPALCFVSRNGQIMGIDLFDSNTNYNLTIAAASGSGKSFLTNEIIVSYLNMGAQVWVVDVGRSYLKLAKGLGGDFIEFSKQSNICINPFPLVKDYEEEADMLLGIVVAMASPTEKISDFQSSRLREVLKDNFEKFGAKLTIDNIAAGLKADVDNRVKDLGEQLFPFTSKGEYGRYFNGENNVSFKAAFTVLELEELKLRKHLQSVVLLQLIFQIQQAMFLGSKERKKLLIIDEAWDLLTSSGDMSKFMENGYRRFRKYNAAGITVTQSLNDLYSNPSGIAIAENSAHIFMLGQRAETIDAIKTSKRLSLSDGVLELIKTVNTVKGVYSEIFFYTGSGAGIGRLVVDRFSQLVYSTHPDEVSAVMNRMDQGMNIKEAIKDVIEQERVGVAA
ncbi:type IV secretion system protein TraC [Duganella vulcania]|uniref:Type IV secretion system protein TraC n=1 Tax=Duganella vulcania TaxID=2692166 RepID=A0A845GH13_9BURK|nr:type IV secretion system protein TraC [Duganella vulcania]MYM92712.1 type IV secretion system protein TraC [Duganella vulcania]